MPGKENEMSLLKRRDVDAGRTGSGNMLAQLRRDMDTVFDRFLRDPWGGGDLFSTEWGPSLDVTEDEKHLTVRAEVPGVDPGDLDIAVDGNTLTISGEKKEQSENKGRNFYQTECRYGSFRRSVQLPAEIDPESVEAEHKRGVVTITMEKRHATETKRVKVKVAE
jgi:HSP20 family protein